MIVSRRCVLLSSASVLFAGTAAAQSPTAPPPTGGAPAEDPLLVPYLLIRSRKQIENCTYAFKKLQSEEVKAFTAAEIEEHEALKMSLKGLGFEYPVTPILGSRPGQVARWKVTAGSAKLPAEATAMIALDHEVAEQSIANYLVEMGTYLGREFEKQFLSNQLYEHMSLLDRVQTFRRHASPKLEAILANEQKVIGSHIKTLKKLMASFDKGGN